MLGILNCNSKSINKNIKKRGFTLIELIIVIAIIGILAVIAVPKFSGVLKDAKVKSDIASAKVIADATYAQISKGLIIPGTDITSVDITDTATGMGKTITDYLQNVPTPKATSASKFSVLVSTEGDVSVKVGTNQVYPSPAGAYVN